VLTVCVLLYALMARQAAQLITNPPIDAASADAASAEACNKLLLQQKKQASAAS
jgi:hypothetical protein